MILMVKTYSVKKDGNTALSENFKVKEFKCRDGSDEVKIDDVLIDTLQKIRDHFKKPITIVSGYRSPAYNKSINGAKTSQHMYGKAADIQVSGVNPRTVAEYAESINVKGLGLYDYTSGGFVHVDTRSTRSRWLQKTRNGGAVSVSGFYGKDSNEAKPTLKLNSRGTEVKELQTKLNALGYNCGTADGIFGNKTLNAVKEFQKDNGLAVDGIVGKNTWKKLEA
jgi:hypothetical protein